MIFTTNMPTPQIGLGKAERCAYANEKWKMSNE